MIDLQTKPLSAWTEAPADGVLVTNPPYGERISAADMDGLYELIGQKLKNVFKGYHAWIIAAKNEYIAKIGLSPSVKIPILNGSLECELREYIIFEGDYKSFRREGGRLREQNDDEPERSDVKPRRDAITVAKAVSAVATSLNVVTDSSAVTVRKAGSAAGTANVSARMTANSAGSRISNPTAGLTVNPTVMTNHVKVVATARVSATAGRTNGLLPTSVVSAVKARHGLHGTT